MFEELEWIYQMYVPTHTTEKATISVSVQPNTSLSDDIIAVG